MNKYQINPQYYKHLAKRLKKERKDWAIDYKGGKCSACGYNKYRGALEFHHLNPENKSFELNVNGLLKAFDKVKIELDKCIMLCANCHRELEDSLRQK